MPRMFSNSTISIPKWSYFNFYPLIDERFEDIFQSQNGLILTSLPLILTFALLTFQSQNGLILTKNHSSGSYATSKFQSQNGLILTQEDLIKQ